MYLYTNINIFLLLPCAGVYIYLILEINVMQKNMAKNCRNRYVPMVVEYYRVLSRLEYRLHDMLLNKSLNKSIRKEVFLAISDVSPAVTVIS